MSLLLTGSLDPHTKETNSPYKQPVPNPTHSPWGRSTALEAIVMKRNDLCNHGKCSCYSFHLQAPHSSFPQNVAAAAGAQCTMIGKLCWVWTSRVSSILLGLELITSMREKRESGERERERER